jgi:hypothetical protein
MIIRHTHSISAGHFIGTVGLRRLLIGTHEFRAKDYLSALFDVSSALASYRFTLIPTVPRSSLFRALSPSRFNRMKANS